MPYQSPHQILLAQIIYFSEGKNTERLEFHDLSVDTQTFISVA
ncbi:Uncharacterised protein [Grimontia hollisae]|uniref:Uncharacterized protein n=2 Tax=Grimontia hollisae TaxID=673 RepID=D0IAM8_GRIHO|nr:hypothetical protein VHA_002805 [Grimontia hollisae CIP 101886]STO44482.1 Uncharacterised protein [Grimontia hollisae]STO57386.1 Uncharacterised protein [Grimontia hollisae]STQ75237.1 Uncharacterised protein [Grimontia hollisae]